MKKFKKTLSLVLALVMCLSLANITVFADVVSEESTEAQAAYDKAKAAFDAANEQYTVLFEAWENAKAEAEKAEATLSDAKSEAARLEALPAQIEAAKAEVARAQSACDAAQSNLKTAEKALADLSDAATEEEIATAQAAVEAAQEAVNAAQSNLEAAGKALVNLGDVPTEEEIATAQAAVGAAQEAVTTANQAESDAAIACHDYRYEGKTCNELYAALCEAEAALRAAELNAYPFTGEWSKAEDGTDVLTITGEGVYKGTFALVENGERVKLVSKPNDKSYAVVLNVDEVGDNAFTRCSKLTTVTLGNSVTKIGNRAFEQCSQLNSVNLENVTELGNYAFCKTALTGELTLDNVTSIGLGAFAYCNGLTSINLSRIGSFGHSVFLDCKNLTQATFVNCTEISYRAMRSCPALETVTITDTATVGWLAFQDCSSLTTVTMNRVGLIEGGAFENCTELTTISIDGSTKLGYVDADRNLVGVIPGIDERVEGILKGTFSLNPAETIVELTPAEGWDDSKVAKSDNWNGYDYGTQLVEQARWTNTDRTEAEVKVDAYYTAQKQMDFIFVLDLSNSMTKLGNPDDKNARFYDMQSKLLDVTDELMNTPGYDCRVAFTTFGLTSSEKLGFYSNSIDARAAIMDLVPYYENTNYGLGLVGAKALVKTQEPDRETTVIFISDGQPRDDKDNTTFDLDGSINAAAIKELGVPIYGVLQSVPDDELAGAEAAMRNVCSEGLFFRSSDTAGFSEAVNKAIAAAYTNHTVTIPVNPAFENVRNLTVSASAGEASVSADGKTITWTIIGMPFTKHTLTYRMSLTQENANLYGTYTYPVNSGNAVIADGASVASPELTRTVNPPYVPTYYTLTVHYVYADGTTAAPDATRTLVAGSSYTVDSPVIEGYTPDRAVVTGTLNGNDTLTVVYTAAQTEPETTRYTLTVSYVYEDGTEAATAHTETLDDGAAYSVASPEIEGYTADIVLVAGTIEGADASYVVTYSQVPDEEELEDPDTPLVENPGEEEIGDEDTPLVDNPGEEEIGDEDTPLTDVPQTGDFSPVWCAALILSACGLVLLNLKRRKDTEY